MSSSEHIPSSPAENTENDFIQREKDKYAKEFKGFAADGKVYVEIQMLTEEGDRTITVTFPLSEQASLHDLLRTAGPFVEGTLGAMQRIQERGKPFVTIEVTEPGLKSQYAKRETLKKQMAFMVEVQTEQNRDSDPARSPIRQYRMSSTRELAEFSSANPDSFKPLVTETGLQKIDQDVMKTVDTLNTSIKELTSYR